MTAFGIIIWFFPALIVAGALACVVWFVVAPGIWPALALLAVLYLVPVACFRLHQAIAPIVLGGSRLVGKRYSPWWGAYQLQLVYSTFPALERVLHLVPGLFSLWLRAWGSKVGTSVYWTPTVAIYDRSLVDIGDQVIFGHSVQIFGHVIRPMRDNLLLFVRPVRIEKGAFIGAGTVLGPGAIVREGAHTEAEARVLPREVVE